MDYTKIKIPYIKNEVIINAVEKFKSKYWNDKIPVDMENIIEIGMKINIVPIPNLEKLCNTSALISSDWENIYVDEFSFLDERYLSRFRFSLAHEIGHFILHKEIYNLFNIKDFKDYYKYNEEIPGKEHERIEFQADLFASYLLIPRNRLIFERDKILETHSKELENIDKSLINQFISNPLSKIFGVSPRAITIVLNHLEKQ